MRFIGDVHAKGKRYKKIVKQCDRSIQVGDFGMGSGTGWFRYHPFGLSRNQAQYREHRFIRGNHDDPNLCATRSAKWWIPDGSVLQDKMMLVGGAYSIDSAGRTPGISWWHDEELTIARFNDIIDTYEKVRPRVMVTHDAPKLVTSRIMESWRPERHAINSRTQQAFDAMIQIHSPDLWVFGHWHASRDVTMYGTRFICLNELEHVDIDLSQYGIDETKLLG
jgi:hypothetical protein